jgi:heme/copper-type cytochrome/quinol oxidase subunit 2
MSSNVNLSELAPLAGSVGSFMSKTAFINPLILFIIVLIIWLIITTIVTVINRSLSERKNRSIREYKYKMPYPIIIMWIIGALIFVIGLITVITIAILGNKYSKNIGKSVESITKDVGSVSQFF